MLAWYEDTVALGAPETVGVPVSPERRLALSCNTNKQVVSEYIYLAACNTTYDEYRCFRFSGANPKNTRRMNVSACELQDACLRRHKSEIHPGLFQVEEDSFTRHTRRGKRVSEPQDDWRNAMNSVYCSRQTTWAMKVISCEGGEVSRCKQGINGGNSTKTITR